MQAQGARTVAEAARNAGVGAFVQVSAIGADAKSPAAYARTKAAGEAAVLEALPQATIVRPGIVFGREDQFINRFAALTAQLPVVPVVAGRTRFQPVYVLDVAQGDRGGAQRTQRSSVPAPLRSAGRRPTASARS